MTKNLLNRAIDVLRPEKPQSNTREVPKSNSLLPGLQRAVEEVGRFIDKHEDQVLLRLKDRLYQIMDEEDAD